MAHEVRDAEPAPGHRKRAVVGERLLELLRRGFVAAAFHLEVAAFQLRLGDGARELGGRRTGRGRGGRRGLRRSRGRRWRRRRNDARGRGTRPRFDGRRRPRSRLGRGEGADGRCIQQARGEQHARRDGCAEEAAEQTRGEPGPRPHHDRLSGSSRFHHGDARAQVLLIPLHVRHAAAHRIHLLAEVGDVLDELG